MSLLKITLAGQDITQYVQWESVDVHMTLGQSAGTGGRSAGHSATASFLTSLGPLYTAGGAGVPVSTPKLVRMGEVQISLNNVLIFGGYAAKFKDVSGKTPSKIWTQIDCYDYWQHLDRVMINEYLDGLTDIQMITLLISKYAPWISLKYLPTTPAYLFGVKNFRNFSLQQALKAVVAVTGYQIWISPEKNLHYCPPAQANNAPFSLNDTPNFVTTFPCFVTDLEFDDTSAINRVTCYGGKVPSQDYTQDLSMFANGTNTTFPLAYYPRLAGDGKIHVNINSGPDLVVGSATGKTNAANTLKPNGNADVLVNFDAHTLVFAYPPAAGSKVTCRYRYEYPLVVTVGDQKSYQYYGQWLDGNISDDTIYDRQQAVQRCKVLLLEQSFGTRTLQLDCWQPGIMPGQLLRVDLTTRQIHDTLVVQDVHMTPLGMTALPSDPSPPYFRFSVTLGGWNWNLIDLLRSAVAFSTPGDQNTDESNNPIAVEQGYDNHTAKDTLTVKGPYASGQYYARSTPVGDGHDAYPGFFTVFS